MKDDIQVKIDIVYNTIAKYKWFLENGNQNEEYLISTKTKLEKEEKKLEYYKQIYAEYFI